METKFVRRMVASAATAVMMAGALSVVGGLSTASAPMVLAATTCAGAGQAPVKVGQVAGASLEGVAVDRSGRLYTTDLVTGTVFRMDFPGGPAYPIAKVPSGGGGALAWTPTALCWSVMARTLGYSSATPSKQPAS